MTLRRVLIKISLIFIDVILETSLTLKGITPTHEFALDEGYTYHYAEAIEQQPLNSVQVKYSFNFKLSILFYCCIQFCSVDRQLRLSNKAYNIFCAFQS